jgi:uncharacterized protein DUF2442
MKFLPSVVRAEHRGAFRLHVVFNDGSENTIDFAEWLQGPVFEPLKDAAFFSRFFVDGGTVVWPNGADIAPETLYDVAGRRRQQALADDEGASTRLQEAIEPCASSRLTRGR